MFANYEKRNPIVVKIRNLRGLVFTVKISVSLRCLSNSNSLYFPTSVHTKNFNLQLRGFGDIGI